MEDKQTLQEAFEEIFKPDDKQVDAHQMKQEFRNIIERVLLVEISNFVSNLDYSSYDRKIDNMIVEPGRYTDEFLKQSEEVFSEDKMKYLFDEVKSDLFHEIRSIS